MYHFLLIVIVVASIAGPVAGQVKLADETFRIFDGKGNPASLTSLVEALDRTDVLFLAEQHDDAVAHALELEIFRQAVEKYQGKRNVALSLEMFERDIQVVMDEYLSGSISEAQFLASARPWPNYATDYKPLVELARQRRLSVVAANAPRRYVNMVSRNGRDSLNGLSKQAKAWLPPLPYGQPSEAYAKKFKALMGPSAEAQMGLDNILASQSLWDAAMADSLTRYLKERKGSLIVHLTGSFHAENRLGTVDHLLAYRPKTRALVVTMKYEDDFRKFDPARHLGLGDFVILTDAKQPRSKK